MSILHFGYRIFGSIKRFHFEGKFQLLEGVTPKWAAAFACEKLARMIDMIAKSLELDELVKYLFLLDAKCESVLCSEWNS